MQGVIAVCLRLLGLIFVIGLLGSALVVLLTTLEDLSVVFGKEETPSDSEAGAKADERRPAASNDSTSPLRFSAS